MQESGGKLREDASTEDNYGSMKLISIQMLNGNETELTDRIEYVQPDDGNVHDRTLVKVPLPKAVAPGEQVTLLTSFTVQLPQVFARMGYAGDFMMAGQWYPKIAVYEPKGTRGQAEEGWNLHQYHGNSEFYADFGIYNVKLRVPVGYTVAASGFPTKPVVNDGKTRLYTFYADDVHDFAWAASPNFVYFEEPYATKDLPGVRIKLYLDPKHEHLKARYMTAAKKKRSPAIRNGTAAILTRHCPLSCLRRTATAPAVWSIRRSSPLGEQAKTTRALSSNASSFMRSGISFFYGMVASNEFEEACWTKGSRPTPKIG